MKKKYLIIGLVAITAGACISVLADNTLNNHSAFKWLSGGSTVFAKNSSSKASAPKVNDDPATTGTFVDTLANAQVSEHQDGDTIVVMSATGDLPGTLTVKVHRDASGTTITGGEWAFNVSYTEEIANEDGSHSETFIQRGTLKGTIASGQAVAGPDGSVSSIANLQLLVDGGTLTFGQTTSGSGLSQQSDLNTPANATGGLTLTF